MTNNLESLFPGLANKQYSIESPEDVNYNCIAWASGEDHRWWWPTTVYQEYYWPPDCPRESTLNSFIKAFETIGYKACYSRKLEAGFEKVAIYVDDNNRPKHVARQLEDEAWTSKLGRYVDIKHEDLKSLEGQKYGTVAQLMKRSRNLPK